MTLGHPLDLELNYPNGTISNSTGVASLPSVLRPDLSHRDIKPMAGYHPPGKAPGTARGEAADPSPTRPPQCPSFINAARAPPVADPARVPSARRLQTRPAPAQPWLPAAAARRLRAPSRLSPRGGQAGRRGGRCAQQRRPGADGDGAAIVPQPLPGALEEPARRAGRRDSGGYLNPPAPAATPRPCPPPQFSAPPLWPPPALRSRHAAAAVPGAANGARSPLHRPPLSRARERLGAARPGPASRRLCLCRPGSWSPRSRRRVRPQSGSRVGPRQPRRPACPQSAPRAATYRGAAAHRRVVRAG
ncbi:PREDICTED: basic proline-rich protein-like [Chrysochloris asiatica]|uniref:Basic proline-rich protein-like n=1 Tax=Chrysochloris asiatica TaxID=185453 RepID=A0A9B0TL36_CHRAS|nr:PREDICTED: basic proline-rich protein-like [Chrysochloris asiatica]